MTGPLGRITTLIQRPAVLLVRCIYFYGLAFYLLYDTCFFTEHGGSLSDYYQFHGFGPPGLTIALCLVLGLSSYEHSRHPTCRAIFFICSAVGIVLWSRYLVQFGPYNLFPRLDPQETRPGLGYRSMGYPWGDACSILVKYLPGVLLCAWDIAAPFHRQISSGSIPAGIWRIVAFASVLAVVAIMIITHAFHVRPELATWILAGCQ